MLQTASALRRVPLSAKDGEIGRCKDFLFDERHWTVRYMVADTGKWIPGRKVLISPFSLKESLNGASRFPVELTKHDIETAPPLADDAPVSRQHETAFHQHYGYPYYWDGSGIWGAAATPFALRQESPVLAAEPSGGDPNLRSVNEVTGYAMQATDGEVGHVEDVVIDDQDWAVRYLVVDTRNWLPGRKVVLAPGWIRAFDWATKSATADLTRTQIERSPEYRDTVPINRDYERRLHWSYERPAYWEARGL